MADDENTKLNSKDDLQTGLVVDRNKDSYDKELALCEYSGGDIKAIKAAGLDLNQLTEIRKGLQSGVDINRYLDASIPWEEMEELRQEIAQGVDMSGYRKLGYSTDQISEIREGLSKGLDVSQYDSKEYFAGQMHEIRLGLEDGLQVVFYQNPAYDYDQMSEIRKGLQDNLDISFYTKPEIPALKMKIIRESVADGLYFKQWEINELDAGILDQLHQAYLQKVNISDYAAHGYDSSQLEQIRISMVEKLPFEKFMHEEMHGQSMHEIRLGLEEGIDVSIYAKDEFSWQQMHEIRKGLESRVDVSLYTNQYYQYRQMREIRLGLEKGIDVSLYSTMMYTATDMRKIRLKIEAGEEVYRDNPVPRQTSSDEKKKKGHYIRLSDDNMECYLTLPKITGSNDYTLDLVIELLKKANIVNGIDRDAISTMLIDESYDKEICAAHGKKPVDGKDGYYVYFFNTNIPTEQQFKSDGSLDYKNARYIEKITSGTKIAEYHKAVAGIDGYTVNGVTLKGKSGKELPILKGQGFMQMPDGVSYCSVLSGTIAFKKDQIFISRLLETEDVGLADGVIRYTGTVHVKGSISNGAEIYATGDVIVDGNFDSAIIEAEGNVVLFQGASGRTKGRITAGGSISGVYFMGMEINAGEHVNANSFVNCNINTKGKVICHGVKGAIYGGDVQALMGIETAFLGNEQNCKTIISLGVTNKLIGEYNEKDRDFSKVKSQLALLRKEQSKIERTTLVSNKQIQWKTKIDMASDMKEKELAKLENQRDIITDTIHKVSGACARVTNTVYEGTIIVIDGVAIPVTQNRQSSEGIVFRREKHGIG